MPIYRVEVTEEQRESSENDSILHRQIGEGFTLDAVLNEVRRHYLTAALTQTRNQRTEAAHLLGLPNYQMMNRMIRLVGLDTEWPAPRHSKIDSKIPTPGGCHEETEIQAAS